MSKLSARVSFDPGSVREQLTKIVSSAGFAESQRMSRFLEFVVEETLNGRGQQLKEM